VDWHISGPFGFADGIARWNYYNLNGAPSVLFDGYDLQVGGGQDMYPTYAPIVATHLTDLSKLLVDAHVLFDEVTDTGSVTVTCEVAPGEVISNPAECKIRVVVYENDINQCCGPGGITQWENIARDMLPETPLTISTGGQVQTFTLNFAINEGWDGDQLHAIAFVQRDTTKRQLNAALAVPTYDALVANLDPIVQKVPSSSPANYDTQVTYSGVFPSDVTVALDKSSLPAGWDAVLVWDSTNYPTDLTIPAMTPSQVEDVQVRVTPLSGQAGLGTVTVTVTPVEDPLHAKVNDYHTFADTEAILFVDDDNSTSFDLEFMAAIEGANHFAVTFNFDDLGTPQSSFLSLFDAVVWNTGELQTKTIGVPAQTELIEYLDNGGALFVSSQGYLNHQGSASPNFTQNYLRVLAWTQDAGCATATGVAGDPIGGGLNLPMSYPFADKADRITANTGGVIWLNAPANGAGVRYDSGTFRTVFMSAAFEGISDVAADPNNQAAVMERILEWLVPAAATGVETIAGTTTFDLLPNSPNPFANQTSLKFALPASGPARLTVFDIAGRRVAELVNRTMDAGVHSVTWDGRDASGATVASGVYLARLEAAGKTMTREMVRLK
jgi:hypothetical protein